MKFFCFSLVWKNILKLQLKAFFLAIVCWLVDRSFAKHLKSILSNLNSISPMWLFISEEFVVVSSASHLDGETGGWRVKSPMIFSIAIPLKLDWALDNVYKWAMNRNIWIQPTI